MSFIAVRTQLNTIITGIAAASGIATIYAYPPTVAGTTPAVAILDDTSGDEYGTTQSNKANINFIVRVMVEKAATGTGTPTDATQVTQLLTICDSLMTEIRKESNHTLTSGGVANAHSVIIDEVTPTEVGECGDQIVFYKDIKIKTSSLQTVV